MKYRSKRLLSMMMVIILILSSLSSAAYAATGEQAQQEISFEPAEPAVTKLTAARLSELEGEEAVYFGTATADMGEKDRYYSIPIYREGDLATEASVSLLTLDVSASYGEDYELADEDVYVSGQEQTMLEQGQGTSALMTGEEVLEQQQKLEEAYEELNASDSEEVLSEEAGETEEGKEAEEPEETKEEIEEEEEEEEPLFGDFSASILESLNIQIGDDIDEEQLSEHLLSSGIDYSAGKVIHFAPGESEKTVVFRTMDDDEEEGQEMFMFILADAEGTVVRKQYSFSFVIEDDEELHDSVISFSDESYASENGQVTLTVVRTGSEYAMIDFTLKSCQDTAIPGENYEEFNEVITMQPYQTEAEYTFDVFGEGRMEVLLEAGTSSEVGEIELAEVLIDVQETKEELKAVRESEKIINTLAKSAGIDEKQSYWRSVTVEDAEGDGLATADPADTKKFDIYHNGKKYTVFYEITETAAKVRKGRIIDPDYGEKNVVVGDYYFVSDEFFNYGLYYGYDDPAKRGSQYDGNTDLSKACGHVWWYTKTVWKTGGSQMRSKDMDLHSILYSKVAPDWEGCSDTGWWHKFLWGMRYVGGEETVKYRNHKNEGRFERTVDASVEQYIPNTWSDAKMAVLANAEDNGNSRNYNDLKVYGFAFFYKKYECILYDIPTLDYQTAQGGTLDKMLPVDLKLSSGLEIEKGKSSYIYLNDEGQRTALNFTTKSAVINGASGVFGKIESWNMIYAMNEKDAAKRTVKYPEDFIRFLRKQNGDDAKKFFEDSQLTNDSAYIESYIKSRQLETKLTTIDFDTYFALYLQYLARSYFPEAAFGGVDNKTYYSDCVQLGFSPNFTYNNVKVKVLDPANGTYGKFKDSRLAVRDDAYEFHAGDTFDMSVIATRAGQVPEGFEVSYDLGVQYDTIRTSSTYTIPGNFEGTIYLRPLLSQQENHIEVEFLNGAENTVEVQGLIPQTVLSQKAALRGKNVLDIDPGAATLTERMKPAVGEIYYLEIRTKVTAPSGYVYRPYVIENMGAANPKKIYSNSFPVLAKGMVADNGYYIGVDLVKETDLKTYTVTGNVCRQQLKSKVVTADLTRTDPANGMLVITSGSEEIKSVTDPDTGKVTEVRLANKISAETDIDGIYKLTGVTGRPGDYIALLASTDLNNGNVQYVQIPENGSTTFTAKTLTITYPFSAPEVMSVNYSYQDVTHLQEHGTDGNAIYIYDDTITISVVVNEKARKAGEVFLVAYHTQEQNSEDRRTIPLARQGSSDVWKAEIASMNKVFTSGDRLYAYIVDAEPRTLSMGKDENGKEITKTMDLVYPVMDTGLVFTESISQPKPQWYQQTFNNANKDINIPILGGEGNPGATSGMLSFNRLFLDDDKGYVDTVGVGLSADMMSIWMKMNRWNNYKKSVLVRDKAAAEKALSQYNKRFADLKANEKDYINAPLASKMRHVIAEGNALTDIDTKTAEIADLNKALQQNKEDAKKTNSWLDNEKGLDTETLFGADITFAIALDFVKVNGKYVYAASQLNFGFSVWVDHTKFKFFLCKIPGFVNFGGGLQLSYSQGYTTEAGAAAMTAGHFANVGGNISQVISTNPGRGDSQFMVGMNGYIGAGVGIKDVVSVAGSVSIAYQAYIPTTTIPIPKEATAQEAQLIANANRTGHIIDFTGGFEFTMLLLKMKLDIVQVKKGFGSMEGVNEVKLINGLGKKTRTTAGAGLETADAGLQEADAGEIETVISEKGNEVLSIVTKNSGTSDMTGFGEGASGADMDTWAGGDYAVPQLLQADAADDTSIQTVPTDDNGSLFVVFVGNRDDADALYWTNYDAVNDEWDEPLPLDPDGIYESVPDISLDGDHITVTWSSAEGDLEDGTEEEIEQTYLKNFAKFRMKASVFEIKDGKAQMKYEPAFLSGAKASASVAQKESEPEESKNYMDVDGWSWYDAEEDRLYSVMTRYSLEDAEGIEDLLDIEQLDPRVYYAEYDYTEPDGTRPGILTELRDISLAVGETILNQADIEMLELPQLDENGEEVTDKDGNVLTRQFLAITYTQDTDGDPDTEEDSELKLCLIEYPEDGDPIIYPPIDMPYTNGFSEYAAGDVQILGDGYVEYEDGEEFDPDGELVRYADLSDDPDDDGEVGIALSNAQVVEAGGTYWLTYLKDGYLFEMIDLGAYLGEMFGEDYLLEMYRDRALQVNGGQYAVTPAELQTDSGDSDYTKWYEVTVDDLNRAWAEHMEEQGLDTADQGDKWYTLTDEESFDSLATACETEEELEAASDDIRIYETSSAYAFTMGEFDSNETVLSKGSSGGTTITNYQLVSSGNDVYIVYSDMPKNILEPVTELFCVKRSGGLDKQDEAEKDAIGNAIEEAEKDGRSTESVLEENGIDLKVSYSEPVQLTDYGRVIGNFKASMEGDEIRVLAQCYDQWITEDGKIHFSDRDIVDIRYTASAMPRVQDGTAVGVYAVDPETGDEYIVLSYDVANNGLEVQDGYQTRVEDENFDTVFEAEKKGFLRSGEADAYSTILPVDSLKETREYTVIVTDPVTGEDVDFETVTVEPVTRVETAFKSVTRQENGDYQADITVSNTGSLPAEATTLKLRIQNTDTRSLEELKVYDEVEVKALDPGESEELSVIFRPTAEDFTGLGTIHLEAILKGESAGMPYTYIADDPDMAVIEDGADLLVLSRGTQRQLKAVCEPFPELTGTVLYYSENPEVASVDENGLLTLNENGITTVYAYLPRLGYYDDISIMVRDEGKDDKQPGYEEHNELASEMLPSYVDRDGSWKLDANGNWIYTTRAGVKAADKWLAIARSTFSNDGGYEWFRFDKNGAMVTGWFRDSDDRMYYLQMVSDGNKGRMLTGWQLIDGKWYYFEPLSTGYKGSMYTGGKTRDGYTVGDDGAWTGK